MKKVNMLILPLCFLMAFLVGCDCEVDKSESNTSKYTITYDANGHATAPASKTVESGYKLTAEDLPTLSENGFTFGGWKNVGVEAKVGDKVKSNITLVANWTDATPPAKVTNLTATCVASGTVKLTWTNPQDTDFAKVVITYDTNKTKEVKVTDTPNNEATVTGLTNGTEYTFTVKAYDEGGNASSGVSVNCTPGLLGGLFGTPTGGQTQGEVIKESWMADNGNLKVNGIEISKTSEVIVIPTGTVAKISMTQAASKGELFTDSRKVKLSPFVMSKYEVTRGLFKAVMGETYYNSLGTQATATGTADENPVTLVNWFDAIVFCNKLSRLCHLEPVYSYDFSTDGSGKMTDPDAWFADTTHLSATVPTDESSTNYSNWKDKVVINLKANGYRLPTEAEWEFCARGGDPNVEDWGYTYSGSNTVGEVAWYTDNSHNSGTNIVGCMNKANRLDLYDMSGNVWEWCDDYYNDSATVDDSKYTDSEGYVKDPLVVSASSGRRPRGGCWYDLASCCEVGFRNYYNPCYRGRYYGFRLVRTTAVE